MGPIIAVGQQPLNDGIPLTTRKGTSISNYQDETAHNDAGSVDLKFRELYPKIVAERTELSGYYNCHGLVFAARRTWVYRLEEISTILEEDCYKEVVERADVLPGDVILYYDKEGDIEHSGIVVSASDRGNLNVPLVVSKWGRWREVIHWANDSPYEYQQARFYRITF